MVLLRSMPDWRRRCRQSAMGICAFFYMSNVFGVVVCQISMLDWRRGCIHSALGICAFFNM